MLCSEDKCRLLHQFIQRSHVELETFNFAVTHHSNPNVVQSLKTQIHMAFNKSRGNDLETHQSTFFAVV